MKKIIAIIALIILAGCQTTQTRCWRYLGSAGFDTFIHNECTNEFSYKNVQKSYEEYIQKK